MQLGIYRLVQGIYLDKDQSLQGICRLGIYRLGIYRLGICLDRHQEDICRLGIDRPVGIYPGKGRDRPGNGRQLGTGPVARCSDRRLGTDRRRGSGLRRAGTCRDRGHDLGHGRDRDRGPRHYYHLGKVNLLLGMLFYNFENI